jgi:hypothetical protein
MKHLFRCCHAVSRHSLLCFRRMQVPTHTAEGVMKLAAASAQKSDRRNAAARSRRPSCGSPSAQVDNPVVGYLHGSRRTSSRHRNRTSGRWALGQRHSRVRKLAPALNARPIW